MNEESSVKIKSAIDPAIMENTEDLFMKISAIPNS